MLGLSIRKHTRKITVVGIVFILGLFSVLPAISPQLAYAAPNDTISPLGNGAQQTNSSTDPTTCAIEKVGWILCPVIEMFSKVGDFAFSMLARMFLQTEPELISDNSGTKLAWNMARDLANIMFVIVFLTILLSQVTGRGIDNYGIKRMLPRLIIAAIAVNVSYYICQLLVDLSNIAGWEIKNFLVQIAQQVSSQAAMPIVQTGIDNQTANGVLGHVGSLATITIGVLAIGAVVWYLLPAMLSIILMVALTCLVIVIILLLRKAIIVLLVVISPVAFVLYLLPNTEKLFNRWMKMFGQLLMVFPVVSLLFGGGQLASAIILVSGSQGNTGVYASGDKCVQLPSSKASTGSPNSTAKIANCGAKSTSFMLGLVAAGIAVAPLLAVWSVLKGALSAAGSIGGMVQNVSKPALGWASKRRKEDMDYTNSIRKRQAMDTNSGVFGSRAFLRRGVNRQVAHDYEKGRLNRSRVSYIAKNSVNTDSDEKELTGLGRQLAGGRYATPQDQERVKADALSAQRHEQEEEMKAASRIVADQSDLELKATIDDLENDRINTNDPALAAAIDELGKRQDFAQLERVLNKVADGGTTMAARVLAQTIQQNTPELFTGGQIGALSRGAFTQSFDDNTVQSKGGKIRYNDAITQNLENGILSAEKTASAGPSVLSEASRMATSVKARQALVNSANAAAADPILSKRISRNATLISNFSQGKDAKGNQW